MCVLPIMVARMDHLDRQALSRRNAELAPLQRTTYHCLSGNQLQLEAFRDGLPGYVKQCSLGGDQKRTHLDLPFGAVIVSEIQTGKSFLDSEPRRCSNGRNDGGRLHTKP